MHVRKIQLIAGTTYSVSLPKEWVKQNGLAQRSTVSMRVRGDQSLVVRAGTTEQTRPEKFDLNVAKYQDIDQLLFALFYSGFEEINVFSQTKLSSEHKNEVKKTVSYMSGTEIVYEDDQRIELKVLLAPGRLDINQVFYRISLIISASIEELRKGRDADALMINEAEVDRLYHLIVKLISLSLLHAESMKSSGVDFATNLLPFFLIAKRLEHLADNIFRVYPHLGRHKIDNILSFIQTEVRRALNHLNGKKEQIFITADRRKYQTMLESHREDSQVST